MSTRLSVAVGAVVAVKLVMSALTLEYKMRNVPGFKAPALPSSPGAVHDSASWNVVPVVSAERSAIAEGAVPSSGVWTVAPLDTDDKFGTSSAVKIRR